MMISLNGEETDSRGAKTVADLVQAYNLPAQTLLIEHNGVALHRHEWNGQPLSDGDKIEFIRIVAGG